MMDVSDYSLPVQYESIRTSTEALGFTMASDILTGTLLRTLAASKPSGRFLELGTGTGLATAWILEGMDAHATLISVDNDEKLLSVARQFLSGDNRIELVNADGGEWLENNSQLRFDFIFADTWHGKYILLQETLRMLNPAGFYVIDDMLPQPNWPEGHDEKASKLLDYLDQRKDLTLTKLSWSTGVVIAVKS
jgi:predicted O-methyltransferase YrrM